LSAQAALQAFKSRPRYGFPPRIRRYAPGTGRDLIDCHNGAYRPPQPLSLHITSFKVKFPIHKDKDIPCLGYKYNMACQGGNYQEEKIQNPNTKYQTIKQNLKIKKSRNWFFLYLAYQM